MGTLQNQSIPLESAVADAPDSIYGIAQKFIIRAVFRGLGRKIIIHVENGRDGEPVPRLRNGFSPPLWQFGRVIAITLPMQADPTLLEQYPQWRTPWKAIQVELFTDKFLRHACPPSFRNWESEDRIRPKIIISMQNGHFGNLLVFCGKYNGNLVVRRTRRRLTVI